MKSTHKKKEMYFANVKILRWDPMRPIFQLLALGVGIGGNANFSVRFVQILAFLDTKILALGA